MGESRIYRRDVGQDPGLWSVEDILLEETHTGRDVGRCKVVGEGER